MTLYAGISSRHVNAYHLNNSLLFQFILADFITAFENIQLLDSLSHRRTNLSPESAYPTQNHEAQVTSILEKLVGSKRDHMRMITWSFNEGILTRLKTYCTLFLQHADNDEKEVIALQHYVEKAWQHCVQGYETLYIVHHKRTPLFAALEKASNAMNRFARLIARITLQFRDDENVVYFLLRHSKQIDKLYGKPFTSKLLSRMYPKGLREAQYFLTKRYIERSFDNIPPLIVEMIAELEASESVH